MTHSVSHFLLSCCVPALGVCPQQRSLPAESMAAPGSIGPLRQSHRAPPAGDVHPRGDQGLHHVTARVGPRYPQVQPTHIHTQTVLFVTFLTS